MTCEKLSFDTWDEAQHVVNIANKIGRGQRRRQILKTPRGYIFTKNVENTT